MVRCKALTLGVLLVFCGAGPGVAQVKPTLVERGKSATALVEVASTEGEANGSAFCVDRSGLFVTNAHVVEHAVEKQGAVRLVLDIGSATQRSLPAKVLRLDREIDLALLQVKPDPRLTPLELGRDADLKDLAEVTTFGYPLGKDAAVGRAKYPDITILRSRITSLRRDKGQLAGVQFDNQINPGNSGGPVVDEAGRVVGVAVATVRGAALNLAIPVGRLADFLATPGLVFELPPVPYETRTRPVTWTVQVTPPTPVARLPEPLAVIVTVKGNDGQPRSFPAQPAGDGIFKATVVPDLEVDVAVRDTATRRLQFGAYVKDDDVRVGGETFRLSDLDYLLGGSSPQVKTRQGKVVRGKIQGVGKAKRMGDNAAVTIDLEQAIEVTVQRRPLNFGSLPTPSVEALIEAKQGSKVLATLSRRALVTVAPAAPTQPTPPPVRSGFHLATDEGLLRLGAALEADGLPRGAGQAIRPPQLQVAIPAARLAPAPGNVREEPLVRQLAGTISDVAVGGGGRFLLLTMSDVRRLAVFDVNAADVVKTINLPSPYALVAAGARKVLILFPDERLLRRWDLATLQQDGGTRPSPIKGPVMRLALGSDSDGPALACWQEEGRGASVVTRFSFIDLDALNVRTVGSIDSGKARGDVSPSGGSFTSDWSLSEQVHLRAAAGGGCFGIWDTGRSHSVILSAHGNALAAVAPTEIVGHLVPSPDGRTLFTSTGSRLDAAGKPIGSVEPPAALGSRAMTIPSPDPGYYLTVAGLPPVAYSPHLTSGSAGPVTATVHAAADGSPLVTVHGLDEMGGTVRKDDWYKEDFTADKRFHLLPAAHLLVTIPPTNDRLVLRRLELDQALDRAGGDRLTVVSPTSLTAAAGQTFEHRIVARSPQGGITFTLARGPAGMAVAADGKLTWMVPQKLKGSEVSAVISVGDASGQEVFHTLKIRVE